MKRIVKLFIAVVFISFIARDASAVVSEGQHIKDALSGVGAGGLVVVDLDSTIMRPAQMLGSDAWYHHEVAGEIAKGLGKDDARGKVYAKWRLVQRASGVRPVEGDTAEVLRSLQDKGVVVMALTSRPDEISDATIRQLSSIDVDFQRKPIFGKDRDFGNDVGNYIHGILFTGKWTRDEKYPTLDKGKALVGLLKKLKMSPDAVTFMDDRKDHVENVDNALAAEGIKCRCIRYGAADSQYKDYKPEVADLEWELFGKVLSDESAATILSARKRGAGSRAPR